jgi:uncharacterized protein
VSPAAATQFEFETSRGTARAHLLPAPGGGPGRGALVLGHGAGGGVGAPDIQAAARAASRAGYRVALIEQPYRVAGRRAPAPAAALDAAWLELIERLRAGELADGPLVTGGRSMGARVACRTAAAAGAAGVLCLAFPLVPPRRASSTSAKPPPPSRLPELDSVTVPTLVVQGERDPFGMPPPGPAREVVAVAGDHGLKSDLTAVGAAVERWLSDLAGSGR